MTAEYPPATNYDLGREQGAPKSTKTMQDGSHLIEEMEAVGSEVIGWAASFSTIQGIGL